MSKLSYEERMEAARERILSRIPDRDEQEAKAMESLRGLTKEQLEERVKKVSEDWVTEKPLHKVCRGDSRIDMTSILAAKNQIRDFNKSVDITEIDTIVCHGKIFKWVDEQAKENWSFVGLNDSDIVDMLEDSEFFVEVF